MLLGVAKSINKELEATSNMKIGEDVKHPDGRTVHIIRGCFLDPEYGRMSNFWYWKERLADGSLGPEECGNGW